MESDLPLSFKHPEVGHLTDRVGLSPPSWGQETQGNTAISGDMSQRKQIPQKPDFFWAIKNEDQLPTQTGEKKLLEQSQSSYPITQNKNWKNIFSPTFPRNFGMFFLEESTKEN